MKAIVKTKRSKGFEFIDVPKPMIQSDDQVLVKVKSVSLCGTDVSIFNHTEWAEKTIPANNINGHEGLFEVIEVGKSVKNIKVGDVVTAETHLYCGSCYSCQTGSAHMCDTSPGILGVTTHGIWAEYAVLPSNILINVEGINPEVAGILEPLGNAVHTAQYSDLRGKHVLVAGAGPIGVIAGMIALVSGSATVTILEMNQYRIKMAQEAGIKNIINPAEDDPHKKMFEITKGSNFDVILEMTGSYKALDLAIDLAAKSADINILSVYKENEIPVNINKCVFKNIRIQTLNGRHLFDTWHTGIRMIKHGVLSQEKLAKIVTHRLKLEEFEKGFELVQSGQCGKVVFDVSYLNSK